MADINLGDLEPLVQKAILDAADDPAIRSEQSRVIQTLNAVIDHERSRGRVLSALDLVVARDAVEVAADLLQAIAAHKFDTDHVIAKGGMSRPRLADTTLYERAGLT